MPSATRLPAGTDRLVFRDWNTDDLPEFHAICADRRVMKFVREGEPWTETQSRAFIDRAIQSSQVDGFCQ